MRKSQGLFGNIPAALRSVPFLLLSIAPLKAELAPPFVEPSAVIEKSGSISIGDGSSYFMFAKDGTFRSGPLGMSGRTMIGRWEKDRDGLFIATVKLGWMNGLGFDKPYRRIVFFISYVKQRTVELKIPSLSSTEVSESYFIIDEMTVIPKPDFEFPE